MTEVSSLDTHLATTADQAMETESIRMDTHIASHADIMDRETQRDITMKLTLASISAQQGKLEDAHYWAKRAQDVLVAYRQSQIVA